MKLLLLFLFIILNLIIMRKIRLVISDKLGIKKYKKLVLSVPFSLLLSILFIKIMGLSLSQAGFSTGNLFEGLLISLKLGIPLILVFVFAILSIPKENLSKITYGEEDFKWFLMYVGFFVGPVEELFYRGFVQSTLTTIVQGKIIIFEYATILASIIFVLAHTVNVFSKAETWKEFVATIPTRLLAGLIFGYCFQESNSLIFPIIIHNLVDTSSAIILRLRKKRAVRIM